MYSGFIPERRMVTMMMTGDSCRGLGHVMTCMHSRTPSPPSPQGLNQHWSRVRGCAAYKEALEARIKRDVAAFRGNFASYDVINEAVHRRSLFDECGMWNTTFKDAFRYGVCLPFLFAFAVGG